MQRAPQLPAPVRRAILQLAARGVDVGRFDYDLDYQETPPPGHERLLARGAQAGSSGAGGDGSYSRPHIPITMMFPEADGSYFREDLENRLTTTLGTGFSTDNKAVLESWDIILKQSMELLEAEDPKPSDPIIQLNQPVPLVVFDVMNRLYLANPKKTSDVYTLQLPNLGWNVKKAFKEHVRSLLPDIRREFELSLSPASSLKGALDNPHALLDACLLAYMQLTMKRRRGYRWVAVVCGLTRHVATFLLDPTDAPLMTAPYRVSGVAPWAAPTAAQEAAAAAASAAALQAQRAASRSSRRASARSRAALERQRAHESDAEAAELKAEVDMLVAAIREARLHGTLEEAMQLAALSAERFPDVRHEVVGGEAEKPASEEDGGVDDCPICLDPMVEGTPVRVLACAHRGCAGCFDRWLLQDKRRTGCPLCRGAM
jgi:hypothetical protein